MDHEKNIKTEKDGAFQIKQKIGMNLFLVYLLFYTGFIVINVANPELMGIEIIFGVNLAVIYGFLLIIIAIIMGLIYHKICNNVEKRFSAKGEIK